MRRRILALVTAVVLLALGAGVAFVLDDALGIRSETSDIPSESASIAPERPWVAPPVFRTVDVDHGSTQISAAIDELTHAVSAASHTDGEANLIVSVGSGTVDDAYELRQNGDDGFILASSSPEGAARGIYDMASTIRAGRSVTELIGSVHTSRLPFRMVDLGAVDVKPDAPEWLAGDDYSHISGAFRDVFATGAPYIDKIALGTARDDFDQYARHVAAEGYTAITFPGLIEYLTFGIDDDDDARATAVRDAFRGMWQDADDLGLDIFLRTDMLTLTPQLDAYLEQHFGKDTSDPDLWKIYTDALDQLYEAAPELDGVLIRIGEAGDVYDVPGLPYYSELAVRDVAAVRAMLTAFSDAAEASEKEVIFRSWSIGVGAVGDMHTDPASYAAVLDGIDSPALIVSTKYTLGDFYSHLPFNTTLASGDQRRIVEFQSRREFEAFGAFPNDLGDLYSQAINRFVDENPNVEGIWTWTQDGGPWRAGPMSLELKSGFWLLYELNTQLAVRLARDPATDPAEVTADWARRYFSDDPATVAAISEAMSYSRTAITEGLYVGPYADKKVYAIGLEPPPMMWIFEWDILTGDSAVLDVMYDISKDDVQDAIDGGQRALDAVAGMQAAIQSTDPDTWKSPVLYQYVTGALDYEESTLRVLDAYREVIMREGEYHAGRGDFGAYEAARDEYLSAAEDHVASYVGDVQHPPLNMLPAQLGIDRANSDPVMAVGARVLLALLAGWVVLGLVRRRGAAWAHLVCAVAPWRAMDVVAGLGARDRVALIAVPAVALVLSRGILTSFEAPAHMLTMLAAWLLFSVVVGFAHRWLSSAARSVTRMETTQAVLATIGGVALFRTLVLLAVLTPTGPGGYWFHFWTDPTGRFVYVTLAFALFAWLLVAPAWSLATSVGARRALGTVLVAVGIVLALIGGFIAIVGLEQALTVWNDQLGLLPWGLSRILGITTYLEIPSESAWAAAGAGVVLVAGGAVLALLGRRRVSPAGAPR